ncbi:MAG: hypothetical protein IPN95_28200 [Bacteroidetes bacterium]|nr:hypothetical protein [Bacteroidota bacterium]
MEAPLPNLLVGKMAILPFPMLPKVKTEAHLHGPIAKFSAHPCIVGHIDNPDLRPIFARIDH